MMAHAFRSAVFPVTLTLTGVALAVVPWCLASSVSSLLDTHGVTAVPSRFIQALRVGPYCRGRSTTSPLDSIMTHGVERRPSE